MPALRPIIPEIMLVLSSAYYSKIMPAYWAPAYLVAVTESQLAGLGEKCFKVNVASTAQEFRDQLHQEYPKLMDGGGFELLRIMEGGGKGLEVIQMPEAGYTPEYLKAVIHHAKIFVGPLQKTLDVQPQNTAVSKINIMQGSIQKYLIERCDLIPV